MSPRFALLLMLGTACGGGLDTASTTRGVLYGVDGRREPHEFEDPKVMALADRAVALIPSDRFVDGHVEAPTLGDRMPFCDGERFLEQTSAAVCSGVLIDAATVLTAGHCVPDVVRCQSLAYVLGYSVGGTVPAVYECAELVAVSRGGVDYALVRLDRPAPFDEPIAIADQVEVGGPLWVVGTPAGVPIKIDGSGFVQATPDPAWFTATLDVFGGSSGSAVYDAEFRLAGITARGHGDFGFDLQRDCFYSLTSTVGEEVVTYATVALSSRDTEMTGCTCTTDAPQSAGWSMLLMLLIATFRVFRRRCEDGNVEGRSSGGWGWPRLCS